MFKWKGMEMENEWTGLWIKMECNGASEMTAAAGRDIILVGMNLLRLDIFRGWINFLVNDNT